MDPNEPELSGLDNEAREAASAFAALNEQVQKLVAALAALEEGTDALSSMAAVLEALTGIMDLLRANTNSFGAAAGESAESASGLKAQLEEIGATARASGMEELAAKAEAAARSMDGLGSSSSSAGGGIIATLTALGRFIQAASGAYTVVKVVTKALGSNAIKWDDMGEAMAAAGQSGSQAGGVFGTLGAKLRLLPGMLKSAAGAMLKFVVAAAPVLVPLLAIAAAIGALLLAWKALKAMFTLGLSLFKHLGKALMAVAGAAWELGKALARGLYNVLKSLVSLLKGVAGALYELAQSIRSAILGALDRLASALHVVAPALDKLGDAAKKAADKTQEFFARMSEDARVAANTMLRLTQTFGGNAAAAEKWARGYSQGVGRAFTDTARQVLALSREFMNLDIAADTARELSQTVVQLGNDIASRLGESPAAVMGALSAAISGNTDALYAYGVAIDKAAVRQKLLDKGLNPERASDAQRALATLSVAAERSAFAYNHLRDNTNKYANQQHTLSAEIRETSELLGGLLTQATSKFTSIAIGALRVLRQWIAANTDLVRKFVDLPDILAGASVVFKALAVGASLTAGALLAVGSAVSVLLSPLGMLSAELVRQTGLVGQIGQWYETAFGGAVKRLVQTALSAKVAGVSIRNWFSIGAAAIKSAFYSALDAVLQKIVGFAEALPGLFRSLAGVEIFGTTIGTALEKGFLLGKKGLYDFGAAAGSVLGTVLDKALGLYSTLVSSLATLKKYYHLTMALATLTTLPHVAAEHVRDAFTGDPTKELEEIEKARKDMGGLFDVKALREGSRAAQEELRKLQEAAADTEVLGPVTESVSGALEGSAGLLKSILDKAGGGLREEAARLQDLIKELRDPANNIGGVELDKELQGLLAQIESALTDNPLVQDFKNLFDDYLPQLEAATTPRASAQGTFSGQLQSETTSIAKQGLLFQRQTAENTRRMLDSGAIINIAGR